MTQPSRTQGSHKSKSKDENTKRPKDGARSSSKGTSTKTNKAPKDHRHQTKNPDHGHDFVSYPRSEAGSYSSSPADDGRQYIEEYYGKQEYAQQHRGVARSQPQYGNDFTNQLQAVEGLGFDGQYTTKYYDDELVLDDTEVRSYSRQHR